MNDHAVSAANREEYALQTLLRVTASRDRRTMSRLRAESPPLARMAVRVGASRDDERTYYLEEIAHYTYAGDTRRTRPRAARPHTLGLRIRQRADAGVGAWRIYLNPPEATANT